MSSKQGLLQRSQIIQRIIGGMYSQLQMALIVKFSTSWQLVCFMTCVPKKKKKKQLIVDDYIVSTSVIISVFLWKLQIGHCFWKIPNIHINISEELAAPIIRVVQFGGPCCFSKMFILLYQLAWHLVMEDWTLLEYFYEKLRSYKRNSLCQISQVYDVMCEIAYSGVRTWRDTGFLCTVVQCMTFLILGF
jgi:hypothetical protein